MGEGRIMGSNKTHSTGSTWRSSLGRLMIGLLKDESGQSTTEYILILAVVVMIAMKFKTTFGAKLDTIINTLGTNLDSATQPPQ
jgi:Flp pilus assembly pilin Flp